MGRGRQLRRRFRDESTLATLMEVPTSIFLGILIFGTITVLVLVALADALAHKRNALMTPVAPLLLIAFFVGLFWLASRERLLRRRRLSQISAAQHLWAWTSAEMEDVATELFRLKGFTITENKRPDLADGGVDFEAAKAGNTWLVQVKHWRMDVTVKEARELWGLVASEGAAGGILIGTSGFTMAAREFAEGKDLTLIDGPEFVRLRSKLTAMAPVGIGTADPL